MTDLFKGRVQSGMIKERYLVIAAAYTGDSDSVTDLANAKTELDKLFNPRWFGLSTTTPDQLVYTIKDNGGSVDFVDTYGAIDSRIVPFVERQIAGAGAFKVVDESEYAVDRTDGLITFTAGQGATDVIRVSICGNIAGAQKFEGSGKINLTTVKVQVLGQTQEAYKFTVDEGADPAFTFDVLRDVGARHNLYPGEQALKMIYGSEWTQAAAGASGGDFSDIAVWNQYVKNANPFFCAWAHVSENTTSGQVECVMEFFQKCVLDEFPTTKGVGTGNEAAMQTFKGTADAAYNAALLVT